MFIFTYIYINIFWFLPLFVLMTSLVAQRLKHLPAMRKTWVRSLGWEDPLEKEMATHSSIPAWRIPWMEEPGGLQSTGSQRIGHDWATSLTQSLCLFIPSFPPRSQYVYLFKLIFNWRIIAFQYCVSFCCRATWLNHRYTYSPFLLNLPPTRTPTPPLSVATEHWVELPVL